MTSKKSSNEIPAEKLTLYDQLIAGHPEIDRKGKSMPYTAHNGHMFTHLSKEGIMGLRLGKEDREAFLKKYNSTLFEQHGRIMKEFVSVPESLLEDTQTLSQYLNKSYDYVKSLKPKPSKRKK